MKMDYEAEANKDPTISPYYVSVLYGDYGNRKTVTACSMVLERGLLLSSDDSWKVLLNKRHEDIYDKITVKTLEGISQLKYIDLEGYDTIIWDTLSHSVDTYLDLLYDEASWGGKFREKISSDHKDLKGLSALASVDYRVTRDSFRPVINRLFRETKSHIIFTSQIVEPLAGLSKDEQKRPAIPTATFKIVGTRADVIARVSVDGSKGIASVVNGKSQLGKSRFETIQGQMDLDKFVTAYKETVNK